MQRTLQYTNIKPGTTDVLDKSYINLARDLSRMNSKNEEVTTRDGHVFGYLCRFKIYAAAASAWSVYTAPNTWKMRNAFRKFHAYRDMMFENVGVEGEEMGKYGKTIRPLLDQNHKKDSTNTIDAFTVKSDHATAITYDQGEWTYTELATTPIYTMATKPDTPPVLDWADSFELQICEENTFDVAGDNKRSGEYSRVGMIHSYNLDRMEVVTPSADVTLDGPSNPLAALRATGNQAAGDVLSIAIDQELETPPYDLADDGDSINTPIAGLGVLPTTGGTVSFTCFVPAGLARLYCNIDDTAGIIEVEVIDKILCKDMA